MATQQETITVYCVHAKTGRFPCVSPWFLTREEAEAYPDDDWEDRSIEERRGIMVDDDLFVSSDLGLYNPKHDAA